MQCAHIQIPALPETASNLLRNGHRSVMPTGAPDAYGNEVLALVPVAGKHRVKHGDEVINEGFSGVLGQDVVCDRLISTAVSPQFRHPIRIGQEADIDDKICVTRGAMLEAEGL